MNPLKPLSVPEYLFQPSQIVKRLARGSSPPPDHQVTVKMAWGAHLRIWPNEVIGSGIWYYGIFDLIVAEAIARLLDPGETALDIGSNIGQMASLMSCVVGKSGRVLAFEPHPDVFEALQMNVSPNALPPHAGAVEAHKVALSDTQGVGYLDIPAEWRGNRGLAKVCQEAAGAGRSVEIQLQTLDEILGQDSRVGVCKVDVEGHELRVFRGGERVLRQQRLRDIIFEDFGAYPSATHQCLLDHGYSIYCLQRTLLKPTLHAASRETVHASEPGGGNYLATTAAARAESRFRRLGWQVLRSRR
ncbi:MAG TPA: FkbM family methyltransferase [Methylomirabilota bacterium]|nr:FkbM family methyltransferase [Methylomirabilota bacterium]